MINHNQISLPDSTASRRRGSSPICTAQCTLTQTTPGKACTLYPIPNILYSKPYALTLYLPLTLNLSLSLTLNSDYTSCSSSQVPPCPSDQTVAQALVDNVEPLFFKYRVNIGFYGHNHAVQRQAAVLNNTVVQLSEARSIDGELVHVHDDPQATVHMVIGTAGAAFSKNKISPSPAWNELNFYIYGYAVVTATNASYLDWRFIESASGRVVDRMAIIQGDSSEAWKR